MTETITENQNQTKTTFEDISSQHFESWHFIRTDQLEHFFCTFRRLVIINDKTYAEVDYRGEFMNVPSKGIRYVPLDPHYPQLANCIPGAILRCFHLRVKGEDKHIVLSETSGSGRKITREIWEKAIGDNYALPEIFVYLVE